MRPDWTIFGACLASDEGARVRIDVLTRGAQGLRLDSVGMLLVDTDFVYPGHGCHAGLFREVDLAPVLGSRPVAAWLSAMRTCDRGPEPPATPGAQCTQSGGCEFASHCQAGESTSASSLPAPDPQASLDIVGRELAAELRDEGYADLRSVPLQRLGNLRHRRAARAIQQGGPALEPAVAALMQALPYPRHFLRFDTIGFSVPLWAGTRPYQVLPFQWTCGVQSAAGQWALQGFLADADGGDPRRAFALTLLQALGSAGPVLAYNAGFERSRLRELAQRFDDLAPALDAAQARILDLFQLARAHYYHPVMAGSWSFKSICRAVAPELDEAPAFSAQAAFARSLQRGLDGPSRQSLRAALQAHGQRETDVLRRLAALFEAASAGATAGPG